MRTPVLMTACLVGVMSSLLVAQSPRKRNSPPDFFFVPLITEYPAEEPLSPALRAARKMQPMPSTEDQHFVPVQIPVLQAGYDGPPASRPKPKSLLRKAAALPVEITEDGEPRVFPGLLADDDVGDNSDAMRGEFITSSGVRRVGHEEPAVSQAATNQELANTIAKHLSATLRGSKMLSVECKDGHVILRGTCASEEQKSKVLRIAAQVDGVRRVDNELKVQKSTGGSVHATAKATGIAQASNTEPVPSNLPVEVLHQIEEQLLPRPSSSTVTWTALTAAKPKTQLEWDCVPFVAEIVMDAVFDSVGGAMECNEEMDFTNALVFDLPTSSGGVYIHPLCESDSTCASAGQRIGVDFDFNLVQSAAAAACAGHQPPVKMDTLHNDPDCYVAGRQVHGVPVLNKLPHVSRLFKNTGVGYELKFEANDDHAEHLLHAAGHLNSAALPEEALRYKNRALAIKVELLQNAYLAQCNEALSLRERLALLERNARDLASATAQPQCRLQCQSLCPQECESQAPQAMVINFTKAVHVNDSHLVNFWDRVWGIESGESACVCTEGQCPTSCEACVKCDTAAEAAAGEAQVTQVAVTPAHAVRYQAIQTQARGLSICVNSNITGRLIRSHTEESFAPATIPTPVDTTDAKSAAAAGAAGVVGDRPSAAVRKPAVIERTNFLNLSAELTVRENRGYDNRRVIHLAKKYFADDEIIDLLTRHAAESEFDVSPEAIREMKESGVSDTVIETIRKIAE